MPWRPKDEKRENNGNPRAAEEDSCAVTQRNPFKHFKVGYILKESSFSAINIVFKISCPQVNPLKELWDSEQKHKCFSVMGCREGE